MESERLFPTLGESDKSEGQWYHTLQSTTKKILFLKNISLTQWHLFVSWHHLVWATSLWLHFLEFSALRACEHTTTHTVHSKQMKTCDHITQRLQPSQYVSNECRTHARHTQIILYSHFFLFLIKLILIQSPYSSLRIWNVKYNMNGGVSCFFFFPFFHSFIGSCKPKPSPHCHLCHFYNIAKTTHILCDA